MRLDDAYAQAAHIPRGDAYPPHWLEAAQNHVIEQSSQRLARIGLPYDTGARAQFDLFLPTGVAKGLMVFVHGGYWLRFDRSYWSHLARGAQARGWAVAIPSYDLCPDVRISDITRQIARAVQAAAAMVEGPVVLTGHSAGGHLVARMLAPGLLHDDVAVRLQRVMPISPVADLRPLLETSMNRDLRLDRTEAMAESPVLMATRHAVPVTVWIGGNERPVFLDQARWLAKAWDAELVIDTGRHHFDVIDALADPDSEMMQVLLG